MNNIINGVASEYDMPMKYENKTTTIFIDTQDMEERHGEQLYQEYLEKENQHLYEKEELHLNRIDELTDRVVKLEASIDEAYKLLDDIDEYMLTEQHLKLIEAKKLLESSKD